jgi:pimeloyl-ACP methyl ester carboxylesterase
VYRPAAMEVPSPPVDSPPDQPPDRGGLAAEWRTVLQVPRLAAATPRLRAAPRGDRPVILVPGWKSPEATMAPLRRWLAWLGHDARHWGLGVNQGDPQGDAARLAPRVAQLAREAGRPVALVGWSLGGVISREVARSHPDVVAQVVTYGTPAIGGPVHTVAAEAWSPAERARISAKVRAEDAANPIPVPITSIFTRRDHVVAWQAQLDHTSPDVRHVEVGSTHLSMGIDPDVWLTIAHELAA